VVGEYGCPPPTQPPVFPFCQLLWLWLWVVVVGCRKKRFGDNGAILLGPYPNSAISITCVISFPGCHDWHVIVGFEGKSQ